MLIPWLFVYYTILQPIAINFKELIAEQNGSIRIGPNSERPLHSSIRKFFIIEAAKILTLKLINYLKRYRWLIAALIIVWLAFAIGILPAIEDIVIWFIIWFVYITVKSFIKGINQ
jgi:hypothetical protein